MSATDLTYPIDFVGFGRGDRAGEVVTGDGDHLGTWILVIDDEEISEDLTTHVRSPPRASRSPTGSIFNRTPGSGWTV